MGGKCVKLCTPHVSRCVWGGRVVGSTSVLNCVPHMCVCVFTHTHMCSTQCVKLCTAHVSLCVEGEYMWGESVLNCVLYM